MRIGCHDVGRPAAGTVDEPRGLDVHALFIDLNGPTMWTLIVSGWPAQLKYDPNDKTALWGSYGYTRDKDVARISMRVETLPFAVEQLTWSFLDMANDGGRIALMWGKSMASASFKAGQ